MTDKNLYINDLLHRYSGYSFTESTTGSIIIVTFKDGSSNTIAEAEGLTAIDAYRKIRLDLLGALVPLFISTTTQRDALSNLYEGTHIHNITKGRDETYYSSAWIAAGGEQGDIVHLAAATVTTTNNTQTTIITVTLEAGSAYLFTAEIIGEVSDYSTVLGAIIECTAKRTNSGSAEIVGSVSTVHSGKDAGASSWGATFTVSGNNLLVSVTGGNAVTVNWESDLNYLKF